MPFNKKLLALVVATTAAMAVGTNAHMDLNENNNSQSKELKIKNQKLLIQSNNDDISNTINDSDTIIMAGNGKAYTDLQNIKFNLNGVPVSGKTIAVTDDSGNFIGGGILSQGVVPVSQLEEGQTLLGKKNIIISVQGCTEPIIVKNKAINMLNYEVTKVSGLEPGETYNIDAYPESQNKTVTANSNGDIFIKRDNSYSYINLYKGGKLIKTLPGMGPISGSDESYAIPSLKSPQTNILPYFVIGKGDIIINLGTVNRKFVDSDGKVIKEDSFTGEVGTSIQKADIPKGYEVKSITIEKNGKVVLGGLDPTSIGNSKITVIYNLERYGNAVVKVIDSQTGKVLSGATVNIDGQTLHTNSNGEVQVSNIKLGEISATASDNGYTNGQTLINVKANETTTGTISLTPEVGKVTVTVNGINGPLKNTKVTVNGTSETTNGEGQVTVKALEGKNTITIDSENYHNKEITVEGKPGESEKINVTLSPKNGTMKITVVDSTTKKPLGNAKVTYNGKTYTTDSKGEVTIPNVIPGDVTVDGSDTNYHNGSTKVKVDPNGQGTGTIPLIPDNGTMKITVVDSSTKKPLGNAKVTYNGKSYTTDSKGEVTISNVVPGDVTVNGSEANYHSGSTKVEVTPNGQGTGTISLTPENGTVVIKVVDSKTGKILSGATVNIDGQTLHTNSNGEVQVSNVKPGEISATASDKGYTNGQTSVKLDPNGKTIGTISLAPEAGKVIVTVNGENGPLKNTKVTVNGVPETTNGEGQVTVKTSEGQNTITIGSKNYHNGTVTVDGKPGEIGKANVTLTPDNGTMKITVVDSTTKKPLGNAKVTYNGKTYTTDSKGEVTITNVVPGDVTVNGSEVNYHSVSTKVEVTPNGQGTGIISLTPDNGTMKIIVVDSSTKKPLGNAKVTYNGKTYTTDSKGEVIIPNVVPGDVTVNGSEANYHSGSTKVEVTPNGQGTGTISLTPDNGTMKITVVDSSTKKPLGNAKVTYNGKTYTTDSKGEVTIPNVVPGDVTVDGSEANYHSGSTKVEVTPNGQGTGTISLTPENGTVVIKVVDSKTGKVLSGATVNIDGQTLHTNSNGEVQVSNIKPGEISATASDKGYTNGQTSVKLDPNGKATGTISLAPEAGKVIVTVNGENGPLKNTKVTVNGVPETTNGEGQVTVKTSEGQNTITIGSKNYHNGTVTVDGKPGETEKANVTLTPDNGTMKITVVDSTTKKPLGNAKVTYNGKTYTTDSKGEVTIPNVIPGDVTVDGSEANYHSGSTKVEVTPNGKATGIISLTPENGTVVIKVVDSKTGKVLSGATVNIDGQTLHTNSNGEVQISNVKPGEINATASDKGYTNGQTSVKLDPNGKATGTISLAPEAGKVIVTVNGENGSLKNTKVTVNGVPETTNGEGQVTVKTSEGQNTITIGSKNYHNGTVTVDGKPGETEKANVTLTPDNGTMKITVVDGSTKKPLGNAKVTYNGKTYTTDSKGEVTITNVVPGDVTVNGSDVNYHSGSTKVEVTPNGQGTGIISLTPDNGTMKITVVDSTTKKPLGNAKVTYNGKTYTTDSKGEVTISNVVPGDVTVDGSEANYHSGSTKVEVTPNGQGTGIISLTPDNGTMKITVVDGSTKKPLGNAKVTYNGKTYTTDSKGEVTITNVVPGDVTVNGSDVNYHSGSTKVEVTPNGQGTGIISLTPDNGTMKITVVDSTTKKPLGNAKVTYNGKTYTTDSKGEVTITNVVPGDVTVNGSDVNYHSGSTKVEVTPNGQGTGTISLTPDNGTMKITVVDSSTKKPLGNAKVTYNGKTYTTDSRGEVTISNVVPGDVTVDGSEANYHSGSTKVEVTPNGQGTGTISLTPDNGTMKITVVDSSTKKPLGNAKVTYNGKTYTTDSKGEVTIPNVVPGNVTVDGSEANYHSGSTKVEVTPNGQGTGTISLTPDNGTMKITVVDSSTKKPLGNAKVTYNGKTYTTDSKGEVTISNVVPGDVTVDGSEANYHSGSTKVEVTPNGQGTGIISLVPEAGKVVVTVNGENGPLKNTKVTVNGVPETTNGEGQVTVKTSEGQNTITIGSKNYHNGTVTVDGKPGETEKANVTLTPDNGTMKITVVDGSTKKPLGNAKVTYNGKTYTTDSKGEVTITNVVPGDVTVNGSDVNYHSGSTKVEVTPNGQGTGTISLTPDNGTMKITVVDSSTKKPLGNAKVTYNGKTYTTDSKGEVTIPNVVPGDVTVNGSDVNYHSGSTRVEVTPNGQGTGIISLTPDNGTMKITVVDGSTKKPLGNAKVTYNGKTYTTDSKGEVTITNVVPGDVTVDGSDANYHSGSTKVEVTPNGQGTGTISLTPENGTVIIKVVDSKTGKVLSGATVNIDGQTLHTNSNGEVQVSNIKPGEISATASDKGYTNGQTSVRLDSNGKATGTISLAPEAGKVIVTVNGENGPLKNTKVTVNGVPETTNGEGQVTVKTSEGQNTITIGSKNYHNGTVTVDGKPGETEKANVTLTLDNGTMKITVVDGSTKKPLGNAKVTYNGKTYTTDSKGEVTIPNVVPGDVTVDGSEANYHSGSTKVEVTPNGQGTGTISLTPENGTVVIKVVDSKTGKVLSGATVNIDGQTLHTNSNGEVQVSNIKPGEISATASDKGYTNGQTSVKLDPNGKATGTISLAPEAGKVIVTVNGENGPLKNTKVTVNGVPETTNGEGQVTVKTSEGQNTITIGSKNYHNGTVTVDGKPGETEKANVTLTPDNGTMKITVVDSTTKKPLGNAKVTYNGKTYTTDSKGEVTISNVVPGDVTVDGSEANYHSGSTKVEVTPNGKATGIISLTPENGTVVIKVVDSKTGKVLSGATVNIDGQTLHTNSNGEVQISNVKPGEINATASDKGYTNGQTSVKLDPNGKATGTISLAPEAGKVVVTVNGENGPLKNTKVTVNGVPETTNGEGQVTVKTSEGKNTITIGSKNYHNGTVTVDGKPGETEKANVTLTPDNGTMKITVVDSTTKKPLGNAKVTYNGKTYTTDSKGEVTITNVVPGDVTVNGSDVNYHSGSTKVEVTPNGQGTGIISLTPDNGTMKITVVDSTTKKPLGNAKVTYNGKTYTTDSKGEVTITNVVPGDVTVNGSDVNYHSGSTKVEVTPNGQGTGTISLTPDNGTMKITVVDSSTKKPLGNAKVTYNGKTYTTDSRGEVTISNVVPGDVTVDGSEANYHSGSTKVEVTPNGQGTGTISLTPDNGTMKITVVDSSTKKPLGNAKVTYNGKTYTTDSKGEVTISNVVPGDVTVDGSEANYHSGSTKVEVTPNGQGTGIISLVPEAGKVVVTVNGENGPLKNTKVTVNGVPETTNGEGQVTVKTSEGQNTITIGSKNYHNGTVTVDGKPGETEKANVTLTPDNGTMKITVVDSSTKKPLGNAKVTYNGKTYTTDSKGEITIPNVVPGDVTVDGSEANYHSGSTKVEVTPNGQGTGTISLTPENGTVVIKVVDSKTGKVLSGATVNIDGQTLHTNSNGEVQISNVKPGEINATASDKGYTNGQTSVKLDPNGKAIGTISLAPEAGKVIVTVNGENGPLKNTKVTVNGVPETTNGEGQVTVKTSEGKNTITIGSKNYHNETVTVDGKPGETEKANVTLTPDNGTMKITVVDSSTKKPLGNARVTYNGKTYTTDSKGEVTIPNVIPGDVTVDGSEANYHSGSTKVEVIPNGQGTGTISLTPENGTVVIKVVDSKTGKVLSGATVNIDGQTLHTNSNGEVQISNVKPGEINATASDKGYTNGQTSVKLDPNGKATGTISLAPEAGKVIVTVNGENGPLKNTKVTVNGVPETTNGEGQVTVKTSEGKNTITIGSKNYHNETVTVDGKPGETEKANVTLTPDNGTMKITVVDSSTKKPLGNAKVTYNGKTYTTDSKGEVTIPNVVPGDVTVNGSDVNYHSGSTRVEVTPNGQGTGIISLTPDNGTMKITVVDSITKKPLGNAKVTYNGKTYTTDSKGEITIPNVVPGDVTVDGSEANYHSGSTKVEVTPNGQGTGIISLTPENGTVVIKVVDSKTGKVLSGATVNIDGQTLHTNSNGEVQISNVKPGEINATASDKGYTNGQTSVKLDPNGKATGIISLAPVTGKVIITVNDDNGLLKNKTIIVNGKEEKTNDSGEITVGTTEGINHIKVALKGYNDKNIDVNATTGSTKYKTITLTPKTASVRINIIGKDGNIVSSKIVNENDPQLVIPKGYKVSSITVNGEKIGKDNLTKSDLKNKDVSINIVNDKNLPNTGVGGELGSNIEDLVTLASIIGMLGIGEVFRRKNRR